MRTLFVVVLALAACSVDRAPERAEHTEGAGDSSLAEPPDGAPEVPSLAFESLEYAEPFDRPTSVGFVPGTADELIVLEQHGRVLHLQLDGDQLRLLGSFEVPDLYREIDCGLIALAFDPEFEQNRFFYVSLCLARTTSGIFRFSFEPDDYSAIPDSMREIIVRSEEDAERGIHNAGTIGFDAEGRLWALFGDKAVDDNAHDVASDLGKVLRIVPSRDPDEGGYEPAGELFEDNAALYARGLRSPWRGAMDEHGRLFVGDVGDETTEELNLVKPGGDHGWPDYEGPCRKSCGDRVNPLTSWRSEDDHPYVLDDEDASATTRRVAWLGRFLRPAEDDPYRGQLTARLLFGDVCSGFVRVLQVDDDGELVLDAPVGHMTGLTGIDQGPDGHLYVLTYGGCAFDRGTHPGGTLRRVVLAP